MGRTFTLFTYKLRFFFGPTLRGRFGPLAYLALILIFLPSGFAFGVTLGTTVRDADPTAAIDALAAPLAAAESVNVNTATQEELVTLPGIGPAKAKAIIDYRTAHPFKSIDEVKNVRGIGDHLYESLKGKITAGPMASAGVEKP